MAAAIGAVRVGEVGVLPGGAAGLRTALCGKRRRNALRAAEALSEEVPVVVYSVYIYAIQQ